MLLASFIQPLVGDFACVPPYRALPRIVVVGRARELARSFDMNLCRCVSSAVQKTERLNERRKDEKAAQVRDSVKERPPSFPSPVHGGGGGAAPPLYPTLVRPPGPLHVVILDSEGGRRARFFQPGLDCSD